MRLGLSPEYIGQQGPAVQGSAACCCVSESLSQPLCLTAGESEPKPTLQTYNLVISILSSTAPPRRAHTHTHTHNFTYTHVQFVTLSLSHTHTHRSLCLSAF